MITFPKLENWESTRKTLHGYAHAVGVIPHAHAEAHPKWWHVSLSVESNGLMSKAYDLPGGGKSHILMNLNNHSVEVYKDGTVFKSLDMTQGLTGTQMGDALIAAAAELGLESDEYAREKFENDDPREYDKEKAEKLLQAVNGVVEVLGKHRGTIVEHDPGPVQLWPHNFDMSFEWFGTKQVPYEHEGKTTYYPSQLNCGFSLGDTGHPDPYFYSNPWPFAEEELTKQTLPHGAVWHLEGWQGTLLDYNAIAGDSGGSDKLFEYAQTVYTLTKPTLME